jgi:hypothetical protein
VTTFVKGCNTPVVSKIVLVEKLPIETDSPIFHSKPVPKPPPLLKVAGLIDCAFELFNITKNNNTRILDFEKKAFIDFKAKDYSLK